jgi:hypothetical protein
MPVILATGEAENKRMAVQTSPGKKVYEPPISMEKTWACWHTLSTQ